MRSVLAGGAAALLLACAAAPGAMAAPVSPDATASHAALTLVDYTYGDAMNPLTFQVIGLGFRPGEVVRIAVTVVPANGPAIALAPLTRTADADGNVAAILFGAGLGTPADGFIVRAIGDEHRASIIDLVTGGASVTTPGPSGTVNFVG